MEFDFRFVGHESQRRRVVA